MFKGENPQMFKFHPPTFILFLSLILSSWAQADVSFSQVFVFGDSLSDTGNLASVIGDLPPPYFMNRASNGPVAVETLATRLGHTVQASLHLLGPEKGSNYAVAGASAFGLEPIDLTTQVISFQANHVVAPSDALYVIFIGGNDIRDARDKRSLFIARSMVKAAAVKVRKAIENLSRAGARSFLLVNSANIGLIPETRLLAAAGNSRLIERSSQLSQLYQDELRKAVWYLKYTSKAKITEFNLFDFFNELVENADQYDFSNTTDACFNSTDSTYHPDCNLGENVNQFIFFDEVHPTARVHALVGEALYAALNNANETSFGWYRFFSLLYPTYTPYQDQ